MTKASSENFNPYNTCKAIKFYSNKTNQVNLKFKTGMKFLKKGKDTRPGVVRGKEKAKNRRKA